MSIFKWVLILFGILGAGTFAAGQAGLFRGSAPTDLGVRDGRLKAPSTSDNSVSSQALFYPDHPRRHIAQIAPLALRTDGPTTITRIRAIVESMAGAQVVAGDPNYLYAQYTTPLMKFVDDVEFWYDPVAQVIQVRSASRLGARDLGVNRKRIEAVRAALAAAP